MELTTEQRGVVDYSGGHARVTGAAGTGKTTALVARYLDSVVRRGLPASEVLVLCRTGAAAEQFRNAVLPHLAGGFDTLPITTNFGFAYDLVTRQDGPFELITSRQQRAATAALLAAESDDLWPTLAPFRHRAVFVDEVANTVLGVQSSMRSPEGIVASAEAAGVADRWRELLSFTGRYLTALGSRRQLDSAGLVARAARLLGGGDAESGVSPAAYQAVLIDDYEAATAATHLVTLRLAAGGAEVTVAGNPEAAIGSYLGADAGHLESLTHDLTGDGTQKHVADFTLTQPFRQPADEPSIVSCNHPAVEAEAIAGELLRAHAAGTSWSDMAVLFRRPGRRGPTVARALARYGVPVASTPGVPILEEPVVMAVVDMLRWVSGGRDGRADDHTEGAVLDRLLTSPLAGLEPSEAREVRREAAAAGIALDAHPRLTHLHELRRDLAARAAATSPAGLAFQIWQRALGHLADAASPADVRALDALVAFIDGLAAHEEHHPDTRLPDFLALLDAGEVAPDPWRVGRGPSRAMGASVDAVTVTSIVAAAGQEWHTLLLGACVEGELPAVNSRTPFFDPDIVAGNTVITPAERRRRSLAEERRVFGVACSRATGHLIGVAAPEPGVLVSRFVEGWVERAVDLPHVPGSPPVPLPLTTNPLPASPTRQLRLSASQLDTYDDCPLRYQYQYVLRARADAGVHADLGTLLHDVLAEFLDPENPAFGPGGEARTRDSLLALAEARWRDDIAPYRPQVEEARRDYFDMLNGWWDGEGGLGELAPDVLSVERRFEIEVGPHRLSGAIDRIDRASDGEGIRVVDYKTGKRQPKADEMPENLQLAVYHLAASRDPGLTPLGPPTQLRLLFLRTMRQFDQPVTDDHEAVTEGRVLAAADRILAEDFEPSVKANCRICEFHRLCPIQLEGRRTGAA